MSAEQPGGVESKHLRNPADSRLPVPCVLSQLWAVFHHLEPEELCCSLLAPSLEEKMLAPDSGRDPDSKE